MSTEATITPYDGGSSESFIADVATGTVVATAAVAVGTVKFIGGCITLDEKQKEYLKKHREEQRKERASLKLTTQSKLAVVTLNLRDPETLIKTATHMGYTVDPQILSAKKKHDVTTMLKPTGETLTIRKLRTGKISIETDVRIIPNVVRQHSYEQVIEHKGKICQRIDVKKLPDGALLIVGKERNTGQLGGVAEITTKIQKDGTVDVDVSSIKGGRCEEIIKGIAKSVGGECIKSKKKNAYFQVTEEVKKNVRA